jgi:hypothetical protein
MNYRARLDATSEAVEAAALARINELEADAARYRWLRDTTNWASNSSGERIDVRNSPELWDSAIDEAIARTALLPDNAEVSGPSTRPPG